MLIAVEGPDGCGKTTLWKALREFGCWDVCIPSRPLLGQAAYYQDQHDERVEALWRDLYRPELVYLCDRFVAVSGQVYARLYNRRCAKFDLLYWREHLRVLYVETPPEAIFARTGARPKAREYGEYKRALSTLTHAKLDGRLGRDALSLEAFKWASIWLGTRTSGPRGAAG